MRATFEPLAKVAPLVGAWIETDLTQDSPEFRIVAPLVGAWIETSAPYLAASVSMSHPSWVRGLKLIKES